MATIEPIEEGFYVVDSIDGPEIRQRYYGNNLEGLPDTWLRQGWEATGQHALPTKGTPFPNQDFQAATCRFVGIEQVLDGASCFFFAIFRRDRYGRGGPRRLSRVRNEPEPFELPRMYRMAGDDGGHRWVYTPDLVKRIKYTRVETRWIPGSENDIGALQSIMGRAVGYIYRVGSIFSGDDYVFVGGEADSDGVNMIRVSYLFEAWSPVDRIPGGDITDRVAALEIPALGALDVYERVPVAEGTPIIRAVFNPVVRQEGSGPVLPGL